MCTTTASLLDGHEHFVHSNKEVIRCTFSYDLKENLYQLWLKPSTLPSEYHIAGLFRAAKLLIFRSPSFRKENEMHEVAVSVYRHGLHHMHQNENETDKIGFFLKEWKFGCTKETCYTVFATFWALFATFYANNTQRVNTCSTQCCWVWDTISKNSIYKVYCKSDQLNIFDRQKA